MENIIVNSKDININKEEIFNGDIKKAYLVRQHGTNIIEPNNSFLIEKNAIKYLNYLNLGIYVKNREKLKERLDRQWKEKKINKLNLVISEYERIFNLVKDKITKNEPMIISNSFKYNNKLDFKDYYIDCLETTVYSSNAEIPTPPSQQ